MTGSVAYDTIMVFPGHFGEHILPGRSHILNVSFQVDQLERRRGGTAANICYTLALLGERPLLCGAAGAADFDEYDATLAAAGVDTSYVLRCDDVGTANGFITTDLDDNQITAFYAGAMARAGAIDLTPLNDISHVVVGADAAAAIERHVRDAQALSAKLVFAPAQQIPAMSDEVLRAGVDGAWLIVGNDYEIAMMQERLRMSVDEMARSAAVAVTRGATGSELHTSQGVLRIPAAPVETGVDPTGAGDAYIAGLLAVLRTGAAWEVAGRAAAVAAAFAVESRGPQGHTFTREELRARYAAAFGAELPENALPRAASAA